MAAPGTCVIVGGGLAAATATESLREHGFDGRLVLVGAEHHLPYERPPLSKGFLTGADELDSVFVHPPQWYAEREVDLRLGTAATTIDLAAREVTVGEARIGYDRLLVATGSRPRRIPTADQSGAPVAYLRSIDDSRRIKEALTPGRRIAIVGGGWIGLEVAAAARAAGCEVTVLEALELPLVRVLGTEIAEFFRRLHVAHGVDLRTGVSISTIARDGERAVVRLADGSSVTADLVVVGIGVTPETALAEAAGLGTDTGIVTDEHLRTSDPDVFAAGDVATAYHPVLGRHLRVEHWDNAARQGETAARNMLDGSEVYDRLPYFFTDQYDLGLEYIGNVGPGGYDEVVLRGDPDEHRFTAFWVQHGRVVAGMHVNDWEAIEPVRRVVSAGTVDLSALRDPGVALDKLPA